MLFKLSSYFKQNVVAFLALFVALGGTGAYAANTIRSTDIVDGEVKSADVKDESLTTFDVSTFLGADVVDGSLTGADVAGDSMGPTQVHEESLSFKNTLISSDIGTGAVGSDEVADNSLGGNDINESALNMPPTTTATFAGTGGVGLPGNDTFAKVTSKFLPAGSYGIDATANVEVFMGGNSTNYRTTVCELRNTTGGFIGGARDRRSYPSVETTTSTMSMNGGVTVPAGGGEVGLYCRFQAGAYSVTADGQMMILKLDGFF